MTGVSDVGFSLYAEDLNEVFETNDSAAFVVTDVDGNALEEVA
jgi:hypothetical protein